MVQDARRARKQSARALPLHRRWPVDVPVSAVPRSPRGGSASAAPSYVPLFGGQVRQYAYAYAQKLQSWRGAGAMKDVFDALQLSGCGSRFNESEFSAEPRRPAQAIPSSALRAYVAPSDAITSGRSPALGDTLR